MSLNRLLLPVFSKDRHGIVAWQYYPFVDWGTTLNRGQLQSVTYNKHRPDTYLHVAFHTGTTESAPRGCSQWCMRFNGNNCKSPAPICTVNYRHNITSDTMKEWWISPTVIGGFCKSTARGSIRSGNVLISVHVGKYSETPSSFTFDSHTGTPFHVKSLTSFLLVEEYTQN